ncbi:hypothetical protein D3C85_1884510 [compost metagenome]
MLTIIVSYREFNLYGFDLFFTKSGCFVLKSSGEQGQQEVYDEIDYGYECQSRNSVAIAVADNNIGIMHQLRQ